MQIKYLTTYKIARKDGTENVVNAETMQEALASLPVTEKELPVMAAIADQGPVKTLIEEALTEVALKVYIPEGIQGTGCSATPSQAILHSGDLVMLEAFPGRNHTFTGWKMDGVTISTDPKFQFKVPEIEIVQHYNPINILADFKESDVTYKVIVEPTEATGTGCAAGPAGTVEANKEIELYAVDSPEYKFDGWFRNGEELGVSPVLKTNVAPLAEDEKECVYTAKFSLQA